MEALIKRYRLMARVMELKKAHIVATEGDKVVVESDWSQRNLVTMSRVTRSCSQVVTGDVPSKARLMATLQDVEMTRHLGSTTVQLVQKPANGDQLQRHILLQQPDQLPLTIPLADSKLHGKVYSDDELGSLTISPDGKNIAFVAEEYRPKMNSLLTASDEDDKSLQPYTAPLSKDGRPLPYALHRGDKYLWRPDWGEQLVGKSKSVVVIVPCDDTPGDAQRTVIQAPAHYTGIGQLQWINDTTLVGVAYEDSSPRPGLIYCRIRESNLVQIDLKTRQVCEMLPIEKGRWVGSPRLSPSRQRLVYLEGRSGGPHVRGARLMTVNVASGITRLVIDYQKVLRTLPDGTIFAGLTGATHMPERCFFDESTLAFSTHSPHSMKSYKVDIGSDDVQSVLPQDGSVIIHDVLPNMLLYSTSSLTSPDALHIATEDKKGALAKSCTLMDVANYSTGGMPNTWQAEYMVEALKPEHPDPAYRPLPLPVLYCGPTKPEEGSSLRPVIMYLHGGPHSAITNSFMMSVSTFVSLGYSVVFPNFRGSLGQGTDSINSLPGHAGDIDVEDCHAAALDCLERYRDVVDPSNVFLYGGSHGGFLVTHLSNKYKDFYRAVSTRNPVTDLATMAGISDIPDWTHVEAGTGESFTCPPSVEALTTMAKCSPVWRLKNTPEGEKGPCPTLLLLGSNDRRVPASQGIKYHEFLVNRGCTTRLYMYEDNHTLSKVEHEADCFLQTVLWFREHASVKQEMPQ